MITYVSSMNACQNSVATLYGLCTILIVFFIIIGIIYIGIAYAIDAIVRSDSSTVPAAA